MKKRTSWIDWLFWAAIAVAVGGSIAPPEVGHRMLMTVAYAVVMAPFAYAMYILVCMAVLAVLVLAATWRAGVLVLGYVGLCWLALQAGAPEWVLDGLFFSGLLAALAVLLVGAWGCIFWSRRGGW